MTTRRRGVQGISDSEERAIGTWHVLRANLATRTLLKRFTRLKLGFSKKRDNLAAAIALHVAHDNFCWLHGSLGKTPAMAADVTNDVWALEDPYDKALGK